MSKITNEQAEEIIIKNYPQISNEKGMISQKKFKQVAPEDYNLLVKTWPNKNTRFGLINVLRKQGRLPKLNAKPPTTPTEAASASASNGSTTYATKAEFFLELFKRFGKGKIKKSIIRAEYPAAYAQFNLADRVGKSRFSAAYGYWRRKHAPKKTRQPREGKLELPVQDAPSATPSFGQLNLCPQCGFQIGLLIAAFNTLSKLKR